MENLEIKSLGEILNEKFFVPYYQRGFRWTEKQVVDLLNDIYNFSKIEHQENEFYCLQPLVVKKNGGNWNLIDGQQRLTTIILIAKYFNETWMQKFPVPPIEYETRNESKAFIENLEINDGKVKSSESETSYIDFYYISKAYETINSWFQNKNQFSDSDRSKFQPAFLHRTKVIWYELDENDDEINSFIRINSGKIPLTNAELIKALFLQKKNFAQKSELSLQKYEMAEEWDIIEQKFQDNSFWYFLTKENPPSYSRIEILFDLIYENEAGKKKSKDEPLTTYLYFAKKSENPDWNITEQWNEIKNVFDTLCEWFDDYERYHCVGFLIYSGEKISEIFKICQNKKKDAALLELKKLMLRKLCVPLNKIQEIKYDEQSAENLQEFYVLYNILYLLKNKSLYRFPFDKLKTEKWDIEHIDSQTENLLNNLKEQQEWLKYTLYDLPDELKNSKRKINSYIELKEAKEDIFNALYSDIIKKITDDKIDKNSIGNLTLLDSHTNRSYGNALFPTKRRLIIERDKKGQFVPPCTKNVFLKYYQTETTDLRKWTADDADKYSKDIEETFHRFFSGVENE